MKMLSSSEAELKKSVAYNKSVYADQIKSVFWCILRSAKYSLSEMLCKSAFLKLSDISDETFYDYENIL